MRRNIVISVFSLLLLLGCKTLNVKPTEEKYLLNNLKPEKYYLLNIVRENVKIGNIGESPMIMFNGRPNADLNKVKMKREEIYRVTIMPKEKSIPLYGKAGKDGVIMIDGSQKLKFFDDGETEDGG